MTLYAVWLPVAPPTLCGSPTTMWNVGFAACSTGCDGWAGLCRPPNCGGSTGGGMRGPPFSELPSSSKSAPRLDAADAAVEGREPAAFRVLEANSFTGGVGATGSSTGSMPSGPSGPMESSRVSSVVDCVRVAWPRPLRVFVGAGLTPAAMFGVDLESPAGEAGSAAVESQTAYHAMLC